MKTIPERYATWKAVNPHVYPRLKDLAEQVKRAGSRCGISMLYDRLRWDALVNTSGDRYKLNDNYKPFFARELNQEPSLSGFFRLRKSVADAA